MENNYTVKIILLDSDERLYEELRYSLARENIELVHVKDGKEAAELVKLDNVYLSILSCLEENLEEIIVSSKSSDIFKPIIVFGSKECSCRSDFIQMGINIFYDTPINERELLSQAINLLVLYQAKKTSKSQNDVFKTLSLALEVRDPYTHGHGERVAAYSITLYDKLGFKDYEERESMRIGCLIHDVGKIGTPDIILKSNEKLNSEEIELIRNHPDSGVKICSQIITSPEVIDIIRHHHEKLNGTGYPDGLRGDEISKISQISTIADIYDALTSDRTYRTRNTPDEALQIMHEFFLNKGEINKEYFLLFEDLVKKGMFDNLKYI